MRVQPVSGWVLFAAVAVAAAGSGCGDKAPERPSGKPKVVATTMQVGDLVREIAGERVELQVLMGPGVDPHLYQPTPADLTALRSADRVLYNGLGLEGKMADVLENKLGKRSVAVAAAIPDRMLIQADGKGRDAHVWFDPRLWKLASRVVTRELIRIDAKGQAAYRYNLRRLEVNLDGLHGYARGQFEGIPESRRVLITCHGAFAYLGRAYGLKVLTLESPGTEAEAVEYVVKHKVPAAFAESSLPPQGIDRLRAACKARGVDLKGGAGSGLELYSDAMGAPGEKGGYAVEAYPGMMRYNVDTIVKGLTGGK